MWTVGSFDAIAQRVLDPRHFVKHDDLQLLWNGPLQEEPFWEMFHGRALDGAMTRRRQKFRAWNVSVPGSVEPLKQHQQPIAQQARNIPQF